MRGEAVTVRFRDVNERDAGSLCGKGGDQRRTDSRCAAGDQDSGVAKAWIDGGQIGSHSVS